MPRYPYTPEKLELVRRTLELATEKGEPKDYSILIDDLKVLDRTNNLDHFLSFEDSLDPTSKEITIRVFQGKSRSFDTYVFERKSKQEAPAASFGGLAGIDSESAFLGRIDTEVTKRLDFERTKDELKALREKNENLTKSNARLKKQIETHEKTIADMDSKDSKFAMLGRGAAIVADNFVLGSKKLPQTGLGGLLAPFLGITENIPVQEVPNHDSGASFGPISEGPVSGIDQDKLDFASWVAASFTQNEFAQILHVLKYLATHKPDINVVLDLLADKK